MNQKTYYFASDLTRAKCPACTENDNFTVPNGPLLVILALRFYNLILSSRYFDVRPSGATYNHAACSGVAGGGGGI